MSSVETIKSKSKTEKTTANLGDDQIKFFSGNDINFSKWIRKRLQAWIDAAKADPTMIEKLMADDDKEENLKRGRMLVHKTMSMDTEQLKFFREKKITEGSLSLLMRRTVDSFKDAIEVAEVQANVAPTVPPNDEAKPQEEPVAA